MTTRHGLLADPEHGPLPAILLILTIVTGAVDAVSILALGRVFVANMTGNVVFIAFALVGAPGFSLAASVAALAGFIVGAMIAGRILLRRGDQRPALIRIALTLDMILIGIALTIAVLSGHTLDTASRDVTAAVLAIALGSQNAIARHLKVPDLTTSVLTMTLTGIAADIKTQPRQVLTRRALAVLTMFGGAAGGAALVLHTRPAAALSATEALVIAALSLAVLRPNPLN
ncbi:MAG TPA: YoaK family protein [Mycobacteriales bacterium]|nr:YoaK family protein [Mycobacteriales bacterium]